MQGFPQIKGVTMQVCDPLRCDIPLDDAASVDYQIWNYRKASLPGGFWNKVSAKIHQGV